MIFSGYGMFILLRRFKTCSDSDLIMMIPDGRRTGVTFNCETIMVTFDIVISVFFSINLERRVDSIRKDLNCLDVVLISVGNINLYVPYESEEASHIIKK